MMVKIDVKIDVNRFGHIECLVIRTSFMPGKMDVLATKGPFIDHNYMVYVVQHDSTHSKFNSIVKAENRKLVISGKAITIF
ncbi:hypothetical protein U0070_027057 [Myodes glareolus]|uniref:glyceraldehyde-3-phosphate dehydrogenase (phosphorylating) n=1 Tax=Myodes glareolus TaxID=447135 RepID=A0AAW0HJM0_MYOGA